MPSISGIENKIKLVADHAYGEMQTELFLSKEAPLNDPLYQGYVMAQELWLDRIRFANDIETREQAERRIISGVLSDINHSNCSTCSILRSAL